MRCEYNVTLQDFREAMKGYRKVSRQSAIGYWLYVWVTPIIALTIGIGCSVAYYRESTGIMFSPLFWLVCICLGLAWGLPARYNLGIRRAFKQRDALLQGGAMYVDFDEIAIRFIVPQGTEISYPWNSFSDYFENDLVLVLMVRDAAFHTISKRNLREGCVAQIQQLVSKYARKV